MTKTFVIKSESKYLKPLRNKLKRFFENTGFSPKDCASFLVAVGEACTNSIRHAYQCERGHKIRITIRDKKEKIVFRIRDYGRKIDLSKVKTPKLPPRKPHGLGIYLLKTIMDKLKYNTTRVRGNELILIKYKKGDNRESSHQKR